MKNIVHYTEFSDLDIYYILTIVIIYMAMAMQLKTNVVSTHN